jgi:hypothetical protein
VADEPKAEFLADPLLLRARTQARRGESIEALESLSPWLAPRDARLESTTARLLAADVLRERGKTDHSGRCCKASLCRARATRRGALARDAPRDREER